MTSKLNLNFLDEWEENPKSCAQMAIVSLFWLFVLAIFAMEMLYLCYVFG